MALIPTPDYLAVVAAGTAQDFTKLATGEGNRAVPADVTAGWPVTALLTPFNPVREIANPPGGATGNTHAVDWQDGSRGRRGGLRRPRMGAFRHTRRRRGVPGILRVRGRRRGVQQNRRFGDTAAGAAAGHGSAAGQLDVQRNADRTPGQRGYSGRVLKVRRQQPSMTETEGNASMTRGRSPSAQAGGGWFSQVARIVARIAARTGFRPP